MSVTTKAPTKVAILGGGAGGLSAAWALSDPRLKGQFEITVYQAGWRLGGKGASGRNRLKSQRIEEHGLHMWFGFYENAFRIMRECYDSWNRPPFAHRNRNCLGDAFLPQSRYTLNETLADGRYDGWAFDFPATDLTPGDGKPVPFASSFAATKIESLIKTALALEARKELTSPLERPQRLVTHDTVDQRLIDVVRRIYQSPYESTKDELSLSDLLYATRDVLTGTGRAKDLMDAVGDVPKPSPLEGFRGMMRQRTLQVAARVAATCLGWARDLAAAAQVARPDNKSLHRLCVALDCGAALAHGLCQDVFTAGKTFKDLDAEDFSAWLCRHGSSPERLKSNPIVRFTYSAVFAFEGGDPQRPNLAAGAALQGLLRLFLQYKGALGYRMSAGMGDVVFAPFYEVLKSRGVRFQFFHRVDEVSLATEEGKTVVDRIALTRQAQPRDINSSYDPLITVADLPCWPNEPKFEDLRDGDELRALIAKGEVKLEAPKEKSAAHKGEHSLVLTRADFDHVVLAIPVAAIGNVTAGFAAHKDIGPRWTDMLRSVTAIPTQAMQLWLTEDRAALGANDEASVWGTFVAPMDTYADMTPALAQEETDGRVKQLAYFCGPLPFSGDDEGQALGAVQRTSQSLIEEHAHAFWPKFGSRSSARWDSLYTWRQQAKGAKTLDEQYLRANILPSERYTTSFPGSTAKRLPPDCPGVENLWLAGDWTDNPLNVGCVEATVMSGLLAARGLSKDPLIQISGTRDDDLWSGLLGD